MWKLWYYSTVKNVPVYWCSLTCIFLYKDRFCLLYDNIRVREKSIFLHILCSVDVEHLCKNEKKKNCWKKFLRFSEWQAKSTRINPAKNKFWSHSGKRSSDNKHIFFNTNKKLFFSKRYSSCSNCLLLANNQVMQKPWESNIRTSIHIFWLKQIIDLDIH